MSELPRTIRNTMVLSLEEAVKLSGIGRNTMLRLIHDKSSGFPYFKTGTYYRINRAMLENYLQQITMENRTI